MEIARTTIVRIILASRSTKSIDVAGTLKFYANPKNTRGR
jgi:hypothetical protein